MVKRDELNIGDVCMRTTHGSGSLKKGETYTITKINTVSARGYRADGKSINQHLKNIKIVKKVNMTKLNTFKQKIKDIIKAIKTIWSK